MSNTRDRWRAARKAAEAALRTIAVEEDAAITGAANSDPDCPVGADERLARMQPFSKTHPELARALRNHRGRPKLERTKVQVTLRLDADIIESFKAEGQGWQSRINEVLSRAVKRRNRTA